MQAQRRSIFDIECRQHRAVGVESRINLVQIDTNSGDDQYETGSIE